MKDKITVGWREWIALPELGIERIKAKVDTGARTSALHAYRIQQIERGGLPFARFFVHPVQRRRHPEVLCEAPIIDERIVVSSNGTKEHRYVVQTLLRMNGIDWPIQVTLTNRDEMGFRMLLGRQALRGRFLVDPGSSYRLTRAKKAKRKTKRTMQS